MSSISKKQNNKKERPFFSARCNAVVSVAQVSLPKKKKKKRGKEKKKVSQLDVSVSKSLPVSQTSQASTLPKKKRQRAEAADEPEDAVSISTSSPAATSNNKLSALQQKMMSKLQGGRFRFLNEKLYTCSGREAFEMVQEDPSLFDAYHQGYREQARMWPTNPLHIFIEVVRRHPQSVVADMGCGEGMLAKNVPNKVHSFDLVAAAPHITACDISKVPLKSGSVDIVVFCLSLMGTNYFDFLREGVRILAPGGLVLIAEVRSRIQEPSKFVGQLKSLGLSLVDSDETNTMFVILHLKKSSGVHPSKNSKASPSKSSALKPCIYKKR